MLVPHQDHIGALADVISKQEASRSLFKSAMQLQVFIPLMKSLPSLRLGRQIAA